MFRLDCRASHLRASHLRAFWPALLLLLVSSRLALAQPLPLVPPGAPSTPDAAPAELGPAEPTPANSAKTGSSLESKRESISSELRIARRTLQANGNDSQKPPDALTREVELLKQLEALVSQQQSAQSAEKELKTRRNDLRQRQQTLEVQGLAEKPPHSFLKLDHKRDEREALERRAESVEAAVASTKDAVAAAVADVREKEKAQRQAAEAAAAAKNGQKAEKEVEAKLASTELRLAQETLKLREQLLGNEKLTREIHALQKNVLDAEIELLRKGTRFSRADLQDQLVEIEKLESEVQRLLAAARVNLDYAQRQWFEARRSIDTAAQSSPQLTEQAEAKRLAQQVYQQQVASLNAQLQRLSSDREIWNRRFRVINETASEQQLVEWKEEARRSLDQLHREQRISRQRADELRNAVSSLTNKLQAAGMNDALRSAIRDQQDALQQLIQINDQSLTSLDQSTRLQSKLLQEIEGDVRNWSLAEWLRVGRVYLFAIWNTEIFNVDKQPITVGKVLIGMLLILVGFVAARIVSRMFEGQLRGRFGMDEGGASALKSVAFYIMLVLFTLTALRFANVPLTIFTLLGGAIAIGVGFGSQNVINNFISGLILLAERPIKVGDLIQLDDLYGNVINIGPRSTQIRTGENLDIIVPNSKFLETNVINLTLGDDKYRTHVAVGVMYGSPTREATRLLQKAVEEHGQVLKQPRPFVWFVDFADNSLNFQVHFWVKSRTVSERLRIESDIRYRIDQLFREAKIVIAFPQRDVHLDIAHPLDVRLMTYPPESGQQAGTPASSDAA